MIKLCSCLILVLLLAGSVAAYGDSLLKVAGIGAQPPVRKVTTRRSPHMARPTEKVRAKRYVPFAKSAQEKQKGSGTYSVEYHLSGVAPTAEVLYTTYAGATGASKQSRVRLPWKTTFEARFGEFLYISAQNDRSSDSISCEIRVNGESWKQSGPISSKGLVSCSGAIGER